MQLKWSSTPAESGTLTTPAFAGNLTKHLNGQKDMIRKDVTAGIITICILILSAGGAFADDTGLAGMHSWSKYKGRTCFTDHYHYGDSSGHRTKRRAMRAAISSWAGFTAAEYGSDWASYRYAASKSGGCSRTQSGWGCSIQARPCNHRKRYRKRRRKS